MDTDNTNLQMEAVGAGYRAFDTEELTNPEKKRRCTDAFAIPFWAAQFLAVIILFAMEASEVFGPDFDFGAYFELLITIWAVSAVLGGVFAVVWLGVMFLLAGKSVLVSIVLWVLMNIGFGIYLMTEGLEPNAYTNFVMAGLSALWFFLIRHKIPFAQTCVDIALMAFKHHPGIIFTSLFTTFFNVGWWVMENFLFVFLIFKLAMKGTFTSNNVFGIYAFVYLTNSWTQTVMKSISHVTTAGAVTTYLVSDSQKSAVCVAFKRGTTSSFGSLCLGGFVITLIDTLRISISWFLNWGCCNTCMNYFKKLIQYFNAYALCHVAIYGDTFKEGCQSVMALFEKSGIKIIVNDSLITRTLAVGAWLVGLLVGTIGASWYVAAVDDAICEDPYFASTCGMSSFWQGKFFEYLLFWSCFLIGSSSARSSLYVIFSGVATIFIVWANDPDGFSKTRPEMYQQLTDQGQAVFNFTVPAHRADTGNAIPGGVVVEDGSLQSGAMAQAVPMAQPVHTGTER